jgi:hypothetical protein
MRKANGLGLNQTGGCHPKLILVGNFAALFIEGAEAVTMAFELP